MTSWDDVLVLVRWQRLRHGHDKDDALLRTGLWLLQPDDDLRFGIHSALARAECAFNLPWQRIVSEVLQFAVFLVTKAKQSEELRLTHRRQALRLLQLALHAFVVNGDAQLATLPLNSCNLLLSALAETLETMKQDDETLETIKDVKAVLYHLFGLPDQVLATTTVNFQTYRPPTNVFVAFVKRALGAIFKSLRNEQEKDVEKLYVDVVYATLWVFQALQKTQTNKKKVFVAMTKTLLREFVAFRHALVKLQERRVANVEAVTTLLDHVVQDALFDIEHIRQFDGAMVHAFVWKKQGERVAEALEEDDDKRSKKRRKGGGGAMGLVSYQKNLFDELLRLLVDPEAHLELKAAVGGFLELLVREFTTRIRAAASTKIEETKTDLKTSRKRAAIVIATTSTTYSPFKFWSELCAVAYLAYEKETRKTAFLSVFVTLCNALFRALCDGDVYRVTEDTEEREQFRTMETVLSTVLHILKTEHDDEATTLDAVRAAEECELIASAVQCSPNLVNGSLVPIFELLGRHVERNDLPNEHNDDKTRVMTTASDAIIALIHAYDSMRLLDAFLNAVFAMEQAHEGLYKLLTLSSCEAALRKAFMALPPGQTQVLWKLLVKQIASFASSDDTMENVRRVAIARLLFETFGQELHVVPQNRSKVLELVSCTYEQLWASFRPECGQVTGPFTFYERELFCVLGELLMFDSVLNASVRAQTFDDILTKLEGGGFSAVMAQLLSTCAVKRGVKDGKATTFDRKATRRLSMTHGSGAAGLIKLCVFWLRKREMAKGKSTDNDVERQKVTRLVIEYVIKWECWQVVAFHLPELMATASRDDCDAFFRNILRAYMNERPWQCAAKRIVCDAGFYEIASLRDVAPASLTTLSQHFVDEVQRGSVRSLDALCRFLDFLLEIPSSYLKAHDCGELLVTVLALYHAVSVSCMDYGTGKAQVCQTALTWIQVHFREIGTQVLKSQKHLPQFEEQLRSGASFMMAQLVADSAVSAALVAQVLGYYLDIGAHAFVGKLLHNVMNNDETRDAFDTARGLKRAVIVVQALAASRSPSKAWKEEKEFVDSVVDVVVRDKVCDAEHNSLAIEVLSALLKYQSVVHKREHQKHQKQQIKVVASRVLQVLLQHVGGALAASMKRITASVDSIDDGNLQDVAWSFFATFCEEYASFRPLVTPLKTYGCLLAVSLSLVSRTSVLFSRQNKAELAALQALMTNANKDEFRLFLSTLVQELRAHESPRKLGALRALCLLLGGDRKLNASRRLLLNEHKEKIVEALLGNFAGQALHVDSAAGVGVWNLRAFVLVFTKAELFTWQIHDLQQVFAGFQPLVTAVSCWQARSHTYPPHDVHELWTLSYTLLLRLVRAHFVPLVNGIAQLVQASNALFQLLVVCSSHSEYSQLCTEWSSNLARLYGYMKEHDVQVRKHVVYLLMAILRGITRDKLAVRYQQKLRPGVFALLDVCSPYEKEQLFGALDSAGKSLLKTLDTSYKLTHRYVGKV